MMSVRDLSQKLAASVLYYAVL